VSLAELPGTQFVAVLEIEPHVSGLADSHARRNQPPVVEGVCHEAVESPQVDSFTDSRHYPVGAELHLGLDLTDHLVQQLDKERGRRIADNALDVLDGIAAVRLSLPLPSLLYLLGRRP
jgi:hypothetical protein